MKKYFLLFLLLPVTLVVGLVVYLGYLGLFPGLSHLMGTDIPRDLHVYTNPEDTDNFMARTGGRLVFIQNPEKSVKDVIFSGQVAVDAVFPQEEITARINSSRWKYMPISNFQIKFSDGNILEFSGNLRMERLEGFISAAGVTQISRRDILNGLKILEVVPNNPSVYIRAEAGVSKNVVTVSIQKIEIGKVNVPLDQFNAEGIAKSLAQSIFTKTPGFNAESVAFKSGSMSFKGTIPAREELTVN